MPATKVRTVKDEEAQNDFVVEENPAEVLFRQQGAAERIAAAFSQMNPQVEEDTTPRKRHLMYWKKCDRPNCTAHRSEKGWIFHYVGTLGPGGGQQVQEFARNTHATPLPQFGEWVWNNNAMHIEGGRDDREPGLNTIEFDYNLPAGSLTNLLQKPGGLEIIPIDQFLLYGLHRIPALAQERWEDIMDHPIFECDHCAEGERWFIREGDLDNHRKVMHSEYMAAMSNARETSKVMAQYIGQIVDRMPNSNSDNETLNELKRMQARLAELEAQTKEK